MKSSVFSLWKEFETDPVFLSEAQFEFDKKVSISYDTLSYDPDAEVKVLVYCGEPSYVLDIDQQVIDNQNNFDLIITWKQSILDNCSNAVKELFGGKTIDESKLSLDKRNQVTYLTSNKNFTPGHSFRQEVWKFFSEHDFNGDYDLVCHMSPPRIDKEDMFNNAKFSIIIENGKEENYFSEKLIDCLASKTIPIYRGCPNIEEYFPKSNALITFDTLDDLIDILTNLEPGYYEDNIDSVEQTYNISKQYWDYYGRIYKRILDYMED